MEDAARGFISIPFGTIKRHLGQVVFSRQSSFQFHLVRLKGLDDVSTLHFHNISIPFGTIKSLLLL